MKNFLIKNSLIITFIVLCVLLELIGVLLTDGSFYIIDIRYFLTIILFLSAILYLIPNNTIKFFTAIALVFALGTFNIIFIVLYEMSGEHFKFAMFNLRGDAAGIIESIPLNFFFCFTFVTCIILFYVFGKRASDKISEMKFNSVTRLKKGIIGGSILLFSICFNVLTAVSIQSTDEDRYLAMLESSIDGQYKQYGMTSNFINEVYSGLFFSELDKIDEDIVFDYLYDEVSPTSQYFNVSNGNNLVMVLCETLEWFSFVANEDVYPNGLKLNDSDLRELFPNLYKLLDDSVIFSNYHTKDKTDVSEIQSMLGTYPTNKFINYDYSSNTIPHIMGNVLEELEGVTYKNNFHNGTESFYNRNVIDNMLGFNEYYSSDYLAANTSLFTNYMLSGERNLDSELFNASKDLMFVEDERFFSYALTINMHGVFNKRNNLEEQGYYDRLREFGIDIDEPNLESNDNFRYLFYGYLATALDFDKSIGIIFDDLEDKNLLEDTTVLFFSDHQAYYQGLSEYVKGISSASSSLNDGTNYMDLYNIPAILYDQKLVKAIKDNNESTVIDKFITSSDFAPTIFDIFGINSFENMYYGSSAFTDDITLGYSRSYDIFYTEHIYFSSFNNIMYYNKDVFKSQDELNEYIKLLKPKAIEYVNKIRYVDQIFEFDLYGNKNNYNLFYEKLKGIQ